MLPVRPPRSMVCFRFRGTQHERVADLCPIPHPFSRFFFQWVCYGSSSLRLLQSKGGWVVPFREPEAMLAWCYAMQDSSTRVFPGNGDRNKRFMFYLSYTSAIPRTPVSDSPNDTIFLGSAESPETERSHESNTPEHHLGTRISFGHHAAINVRSLSTFKFRRPRRDHQEQRLWSLPSTSWDEIPVG